MASKTASTIRKFLLAGVAKAAGVAVIEASLVAARGGMYACTVQAAIAAKGIKADFITALETLMDDFRANRRGIAVKYDMEQACDKQGRLKTDSDGNPVYKVPGSLSTAKSVLGQSFDHEIDLGTIKNPNSFTAIREACDVAKAESAKANATPDDKLRNSIAGHLETITAQLGGMDSASLKALNSLLAKVAKGSVASAKQVQADNAKITANKRQTAKRKAA